MMCGRCQLLLNTYVHPDGSTEYEHTRIWEEHDHEPVPVPATGRLDSLSCDFCGQRGPKYFYVADSDIEARFGNKVIEYGRIWSACVDCDVFLRRGDLVGLGQHCRGIHRSDQLIIKAIERERGRPVTPQEMASVAADRDRVHALFLSANPRRSLIPPPPPPPRPLTPSRLPRVQDRLVQYWSGDVVRSVLDTPKLPESVLIPGEDLDSARFCHLLDRVSTQAANRFCDRMVHATTEAGLYWSSSEFTALAVGAGAKLPDLSVTADEMPEPHGLIVYADPVAAIKGDKLVVALGWTTVPGGVWCVLYGQPEQVFPDIDRGKLRADMGFLSAMSLGGGLQFGLHLRPDEDASGKVRAGVEVWATLLATWFLMRQPGVAAVTDHVLEKKETARYRRAGRPTPRVRLVDLRRQPSREQAGGDPTGRTFHYSVRFLVGGKTGGFWRDQAYGPGRSLRYRRWIAPFLKGPQDAPLQPTPPVVNILR